VRVNEPEEPDQDAEGDDLPETLAFGDCCGLRRCVLLGSCVRSRGAGPPGDPPPTRGAGRSAAGRSASG
jgi:hypothetical protein